MEANEPLIELDGSFTYADYLKWTIEERIELIKGRLFKMNAPKSIHQKIAFRISGELYAYLKNKKCQAFSAPFDVRLPVKSRKNEEINTVVQPDICVICDELKLDDAGCIGAPDLVIEILSKGNNKKELKNKFDVYEESGVLEYWIIWPDEQTLMINTLVNGKYVPGKIYTSGDMIRTKILPGFELNLDEVFEGL
ncbi:MAG: Uma2 family endonuclease [Bacteroidia bacterium]|nr:Uma2 family endonuclease [Bacteroidia bacterium]